MNEQETRAIATAQVPTTGSPWALSELERYPVSAMAGDASNATLRPTDASLRHAGVRGSQCPPKMED